MGFMMMIPVNNSRRGFREPGFRSFWIPITVFLALFPALISADIFKFAILGDTQLENQEVFAGIVQEVEQLKPDFVVHVGNMIHGYTYEPEQIRAEWEMFLEQISGFSIPFYPVPGNHDTCTTPLEEIYQEVWGEGRLYYSFDHKGAHFVILNTDHRLRYGVISPEQLEWLKTDLATHKDSGHVFVFMNRPLWIYPESNWTDLAEILKSHGRVAGVYTGYRKEYRYEEKDGLRCFILNSSGNMQFRTPQVGYFHQFLMVSVSENGVTEAVIPAGTIKPHDYVSARERDNALPYLQPPGGGTIPDPRENPLDETYGFPLTNNTGELNVFTVRWETPNPAFIVSPREQAVLIAPGKTEKVYVQIIAPSRKFEPFSLPYALIETYYQTLRGESVVLRSRHNLSIPKKACAQFAARAPWIDGLLDDTAWQNAEIMTDFQVTLSGDLAEEQTWVRMVYDNDNLYVGIHCQEPNPQGLVALATDPYPFTWGDDDIEIFLDVNRDRQTYARIFTNSIGTTFNALPGKGKVDKWYDHSVRVGKDYWAAEFRLPFSELGVDDAPCSTTVWGVNVRRHRQKPRRIQSDWIKMPNYPYEPWRFGELRFRTKQEEQ